jgi:signal transduction histidine kinase/CheY-like chemotaxis protein
MNIFRDLSIRKKIITIILSVTIISVLGGLSIELYTSIKNSKQELTRHIALNARLISDFAVPTLLFDDKTEANNILKKLSNIPSVLYGAIIKENGQKFAEYFNPSLNDTTLSYTSDTAAIKTSKLIYISEKIESAGETLGKVNLIASTDIIREQTINHICTILIIFLITVSIAVLLSVIFERLISRPILDLANITKKIQDSGDFSIRVIRKSIDETGVLYDSFNDLLMSLEVRKQERDSAENELIIERESLEKRVIERTRELNEAKLKAEESDNLKSAFLANMSHEIRTPLNAILGFSNLLNSTSLSAEERLEYNKMMDESASDLIQLIDDILDVSRIEANQVEISLEDYPVNNLIKEVFELFKQSIRVGHPESHIRKELVIPDQNKDYILNTDRLRLRQVLLNILNNAVKFTPEGVIELGYFIDEINQNIVFYIKDTGIGIPFIKLDKIFDRFTKVADIRTKLYRGTGLGLSISLKLAKMLKGDIRVESEENKGSIFYVALPLTSTKQPLKSAVIPSREEYSVSLKGKTVLIVDDVEWNYKYLEALVRKLTKADVLWAKNGFEAVDICKDHPEICLVLMDIQMPKMNGYEATKLIIEFRPDLPVIAQTAYVMSNEKENCYAAGCRGFLSKPIDKSEMIKILNDIFK